MGGKQKEAHLGSKLLSHLKNAVNNYHVLKKKIQLYFKIPFGIPAFVSVTHYNSKSLEGKPLKINEILKKKQRKHAEINLHGSQSL